MTKQDFINIMNEEGVIFDREGWDSISIVVIVGLVNAHFDDVRMTFIDLSKMDTIDDIIKFIGEDKFDG